MKYLSYGEKELDYLSEKDPVLKKLIEEFGHIQIELSEDIFADIVLNIVGQMLSLKAGETIAKRLRAKAGGIEPLALANLPEEGYRSCGLSGAKSKSIQALATKVEAKEIDLSRLENMASEEAIQTLRSIRGVGPWTAEMIALFTLGEKDIFSFSDIALKNGIMASHGYRSLSKARFEKLRKLYSPFGSIASLYYYKYNDTFIRG